MGVFVTRKCPRCGNIFEHMEPSYVGVGRPFYGCGNCGTIVKVDHINEWDLMKLSVKAYHFLALTKTSLMYGIIPSLVYLFYAMIQGFEASDPIFLYFWGVSFLVIFLVGTVNLYLSIKRSKERMSDKKYVEFLKENGFVNFQKVYSD